MPLRLSLVIYHIVHITYLCCFNTIFILIEIFDRPKFRRDKKAFVIEIIMEAHSILLPPQASPGNLVLRGKVEV